jgi:hypothetical protein
MEGLGDPGSRPLLARYARMRGEGANVNIIFGCLDDAGR